MDLKHFWPELKETASKWSDDGAPRLGAALAYYTALSIAPLLIIIMGISALIFGKEAAQGQVHEKLEGFVGAEGARTIESLIRSASHPTTGIVATVISFTILLVSAAGLFGQLQDALNVIWGVKPKPGRGILAIIKERFLSFSMVLGTGFLLLVSLVISAALAGLSKYFRGLMPGGLNVSQFLDPVVSFLFITVMFAMIYKFLPDVKIAWRDVWVGAAITALLFTLGKFLIGLYLAHAGIASAYGAVGSFVVLLVWVYYSAQIFLFGAEFTAVYATRHGSRPRPTENAMWISEQISDNAGQIAAS